jgi:hypothetical protein
LSVIRALIICIAIATAGNSFADSSAYTTVDKLSIENQKFRFSQTLLPDEPEPKDRSFPVNPFLLTHRPIFVELRDLSSGTLIFRKPAPNLTHLWIDPDSRYFVGLSKVKNNNRVQLIVYDREGNLVHKEHITPAGACLSTEDWNEFQLRFREPADYLATERRYVRSGYFVDYEQMGMPSKLGGAWDHLYQHRCLSPYSNRFSSSPLCQRR